MSRLTKAEQRVMKAAQVLGTAHARLNEEQRQMELSEKKKRDKRLLHLGIVVEQQVKRDETLLSRMEAGVREAFGNRPQVLEAFGLGVGEQESWFDQVRLARAVGEDSKVAAGASAASRPVPGQAAPSAAHKPPPDNGASTPPARGAPSPPASTAGGPGSNS